MKQKKIQFLNINELKKKIKNNRLSYIPYYLKYLNNQYLNKDVGSLYRRVNNLLHIKPK